jgi:hypothetical protein
MAISLKGVGNAYQNLRPKLAFQVSIAAEGIAQSSIKIQVRR